MPISKTILLASDNAAYIYAKVGKSFRVVTTIEWQDEAFHAKAVKALSSTCKGRPVVVLNDMVEQQYRKETISKASVSAIDQKNIIKRKVNAAFSNYPFRSSLRLKKPKTASKEQNKIDEYIFAALPQSDQMVKIIKALKDATVRVESVCLLPIESSTMVETIAEKLPAKDETKADWTIFISQHKGGGLRQIVTHNGNLALTRMTPLDEQSANTESWFVDVNKEIRSTMTYLSRFGYTPSERLNIVVVSEGGREDILRTGLDENIQVYCLSNTDIAKKIKLNIGFGLAQHEGDALHVAWLANKRGYDLSLTSAQIESFAQPRQKAFYGAIVLSLACLGMAYLLFTETEKLASASNDVNTANNIRSSTQIEYEDALARNKEVGFDAALLQNSVLIYERLEKESYPLQDIYFGLARALKQQINLSRVSVERVRDNTTNSRRDFTNLLQASEKKDPLYETKIEIIYPSTTDIDAGNAEVERIKDAIAAQLSAFEVSIEKRLKDYEYTQDLVVQTGTSTEQKELQDFTAILNISGPFKENENQGDGGRF